MKISRKLTKALLFSTFFTLCMADGYYGHDYDSGGHAFASYRSSAEPELEENRLEVASHSRPVSPQADSRPLPYRGGALADGGTSLKEHGHLYHRDHPMLHHKEHAPAPESEAAQYDGPQNHEHHGHGHHNHDHGTSSMSFYQKVKHHEHKFKIEQKHGKHGSWHGYAHPHAYGGLKAW